MADIVDFKPKLSRQNCKTELRRIGFEHQDSCELCQHRLEAAWLVALYIQQVVAKHYPKDYVVTGCDIKDILLTALYNLGLDPANFVSHTSD
jgi:hypothetical protein